MLGIHQNGGSTILACERRDRLRWSKAASRVDCTCVLPIQEEILELPGGRKQALFFHFFFGSCWLVPSTNHLRSLFISGTERISDGWIIWLKVIAVGADKVDEFFVLNPNPAISSLLAKVQVVASKRDVDGYLEAFYTATCLFANILGLKIWITW